MNCWVMVKNIFSEVTMTFWPTALLLFHSKVTLWKEKEKNMHTFCFEEIPSRCFLRYHDGQPGMEEEKTPAKKY